MTKIWGPPMWFSAKCIAFGYPVNPTNEQKEQYKTYYKFWGYTLPCIYCRQSYQFFITDGDTKLDDNIFQNRESLTKWIYRIHNRVNKKLGMEYYTSYEEMCEKFESIRAQCINNLPGCQMPLELKAKAYKNAEEKICNIIPKKIALYFEEYAKKRNINFDKLDFYENILINDRKTNDFLNRNNQCYEIIKKMRLNAESSYELDGEFKGLPTINELHLISMLCSNLSLNDLIECAKKIGIKKRYILVKA